MATSLADLLVRIRADTSDVTSKLGGVSKSLGGLKGASDSGHVSLGRLGNQFENLASRIIGVNPVVSKLASTLSDFAVGSTLTFGVLAGVAAVATVYDKLTESSRKAMEVGDKLAATYQQEARIAALGIGGKYKADIEDLTTAMKENLKWTGLLSAAQAQGGPFAAVAGLFTGDLSKRQGALAAGIKQADIDKLMAEIDEQDQMMVDSVRRSIAADNERLQREKEITAEKARQQTLAIQYSELMKRTYGSLGTVGHDLAGPAIDPLQRMNEADRVAKETAARILEALGISRRVDVASDVKPLVDKVTADNEAADRRKDELKQAIWGAPLAAAGVIVNALNVGGGGRGSGIGGALGEIAGRAAGAQIAISHKIFGAIGSIVAPGVGSVVGTVFGSLIGGLFDHRRAIDQNTAAINRLSSLMNAPSGFRGAYYTYQAEDARRLYRQQVETARRESTFGGRTGFALQAGR